MVVHTMSDECGPEPRTRRLACAFQVSRALPHQRIITVFVLRAENLNNTHFCPVLVLIDRLFILANSALDKRTIKEEDLEKLFQAKLQQIKEAESVTLDAISKSKIRDECVGFFCLISLAAFCLLMCTSVGCSNPGHPVCSGVTLAKLAAVTMDEQGNETFDTSGALDRLRKVSLTSEGSSPILT
ncbi:hypothetical protein K1719_015257 [Acacia pycnantha]|nr:hypothetical protein K1719_015257 [Acacia pycnantha]